MTVHFGRADTEHLPDEARAYLHGFMDYFGSGEAESFSLNAGGGEDYRPLSCGLSHVCQSDALAVLAYRAGWLTASRWDIGTL